MKENKDTETSLVCPFCGAPYRKIIPSDVSKVRCEYCGAIFSVLPAFKKDIAPRCPNHLETFAIALCNDCGGNFCTKCLHTYNLKGHEEATLYLCPECLHGRHLKQADDLIFRGILAAFICLIPALVIPIVGIVLFLIFSVPIIAYGFYRRTTLPKVPSLYDARETILKSQAEFSESTLNVDTNALYDKMLYDNVMRFGPAGREMLDNEISAWIRCSKVDYEQAVCRVAQSKGLIRVGD